MELEHTIMRCIMRIASRSRRKPQQPPCGEHPKHRGFGHILDLLSENDGLSQQQIAGMLDIRPQSASEAISNMEQAGLVHRIVNERDRRSCLIYITPEGKKRQTELHNERIRNAKRVFAPLTEEEKKQLLALLEKVTVAIQENKEEN